MILTNNYYDVLYGFCGLEDEEHSQDQAFDIPDIVDTFDCPPIDVEFEDNGLRYYYDQTKIRNYV